MVTREFIAILGFDEDTASRYGETNGHDETTPGDFLEREFSWSEQSGVSLGDWALVDGDVKWEQYLRYLVQWAINHNSDEYVGMSPVCYDEWCDCGGEEG